MITVEKGGLINNILVGTSYSAEKIIVSRPNWIMRKIFKQTWEGNVIKAMRKAMKIETIEQHKSAAQDKIIYEAEAIVNSYKRRQ